MPVTPEIYEKRRQRLFLVLSGMFLGTLAMLNILGISRFLDLSFDVFGITIPMVVAIGVLPYPITFICTDLISELYGEKKAHDMVWMGVLLNAWVIFLLWLSDSGYDITTVLAGLGIGSIAVALAAQKTLENVIGAFTLYIAKPVQPGDFCRVGTTAGVIEEIGLRSTRIRKTDRTVVYVPNAVLASASIENISESDFRRYHRDLHIRLGASTDQLRQLLVDLRRLIYSHPRLTERAARVRFEEILRDGYRISLN